MQILDGKKASQAIRDELKIEVAQLNAEGKKIPHLAAILVGNNGASSTYVAAKVKACEEVGFKSTLIHYEETISETKLLDKIRGSMVTTYAGKSGRGDEEIIALLDAETWMSADEAQEFGFVDEIADKMDLAACAKFIPTMSKMGLRNIPQALMQEREAPPKIELEKALRNAGCSRSAAKSILAKGYIDGLRNAGPEDDPPLPDAALRNAEPPKAPKRDRVADLLIRAEKIAPAA